MAYDSIPWTESFVDQRRIKASYNGGLVIARGRLGIMQRWSDFFFASVRAGLRPRGEAEVLHTGTGWVEPKAARMWGSNQAALSLALWSTTRRVRELPPTYNYPLHLYGEISQALNRAIFRSLTHVHYHWLLSEDAATSNPLFLPTGPLSASQRAWLKAALPLRAP